MPRANQIHIEPDRVHFSRHPDPAIAAEAGRRILESEQIAGRFQEAVDTTNVNHEYQVLISIVDSLFKRDGLDHDPIVALDSQHFAKVIRAYITSEFDAPGSDVDVYGVAAMGRALVREKVMPNYKIQLRTLLHTMLHEAAHTSAGGEETGLLSIAAYDLETGSVEREYVTVPNEASVQAGKFVKIRIGIGSEANIVLAGGFLEEGFAEYTAIRYMRELGMQTPAPDESVVLAREGVRLVGPGHASAPAPNGIFDMPADYMEPDYDPNDPNGSRPSVPISAYAAYGIELLDQCVPGLYQTMVAARRNPLLQRNVIHMINSVQPGLYRTLRDTLEHPITYRAGLRIIGDAVAAAKAKSTAEPQHKMADTST